jgi:DNA-binding NarL/FixJ family response regulator
MPTSTSGGASLALSLTGHRENPVLPLTTFDSDEDVCEAVRGCLLEDVATADLVPAVRVVAAGQALVAPGITRLLLVVEPGPGGGAPEALGQSLTGRWTSCAWSPLAVRQRVSGRAHAT